MLVVPSCSTTCAACNDLAVNLTLLTRLGETAPAGVPLLVGLSRKSMLGSVTWRGVGDRLAAAGGRQESTLLPLRGGEARWAAGLRGW